MITSLIGIVSAVVTGDIDKRAMSAADISLSKIQEGNRRFVSEQMGHSGQGASRRGVLASGQEPHTIVLTCADSRVAPEILFDQGLGDLFVIRVAGNVVDTHALASIEYAAEHLHTPLLVILGHERCGAVGAAKDAFMASHGHVAEVEGSGNKSVKEGNLEKLVAEILPAVEETAGMPGDWLDLAIRNNVERTVQHCFGRSERLKRLVIKEKLVIRGAVYDLDTGAVEFMPKSKLSGSVVKIHR